MTTHTPTEQGDGTPDTVETQVDQMTLLLDAVVERMQPGTSWRTPRHGRIHVLAVLDGDQIVCRVWSQRKRRWCYVVEWVYGFWLLDRDGKLEYVGVFELDKSPPKEGP